MNKVRNLRRVHISHKEKLLSMFESDETCENSVCSAEASQNNNHQNAKNVFEDTHQCYTHLKCLWWCQNLSHLSVDLAATHRENLLKIHTRKTQTQYSRSRRFSTRKTLILLKFSLTSLVFFARLTLLRSRRVEKSRKKNSFEKSKEKVVKKSEKELWKT